MADALKGKVAVITGGAQVYHQSDFMGGITASSYRFGAPVVGTSRQSSEETA
jgi:hypothetical protein